MKLLSIRPLMRFTLLFSALTTSFGHPGSGIVVDQQGSIYFTDTGQGISKIDERGQVESHPGPAYHFMAIDHQSRFGNVVWPRFIEPSTTIDRVGKNPTLLISSDFPLTTDPDGALYFPELGTDNKLRVYRIDSSGARQVFATLPRTADGSELHWLNGMCAGADGAIYLSENAAVRRIARDGKVTTIARDIVVTNCTRIAGADEKLGPLLRGLDIAADGNIYVAASVCCALLKVTPQGQVTTVLRTELPWSPTGVAAKGDTIYVLEYLHKEGAHDRREWLPRIRRIAANGSNSVIAAIERSGPNDSKSVAPAPQLK